MPWICKVCATSNPDDAEFCFVCDMEKPREGVAASSTYTLTAKRAKALPPLVGGTLTVPAEYNEIGEEAFKDRTDINTVVLHAGIKKIRKSAFEGCSALRTVTCKGPLKHIGARAFANCPALAAKPTANYVAEDAFKIDSSATSASSVSSALSSSSSAAAAIEESLFGSLSSSLSSSSTSATSSSSTVSTSTSSSAPTSASSSTPSSSTSASSPSVSSSLSSSEAAERAPVSVKLFFGTLFLILGSWLVVGLMLGTLYLIFGKEWGWTAWQHLLGGIGGAAVFFFLYGWILSMPKCGFAKTGNVFGGIVTGLFSIGNLLLRLQFANEYKILFIWIAAYAIVACLLLALPRAGRRWRISYLVEGAVLIGLLVVGILL